MSQDTIVTGSKLTAIADSIRAKGGTSAQLTLDEMPQAVADIPGGGGGFDFSQANGISFYKMGLHDNPDLSGIPTGSFTSMYNMFGGNAALRTLDLSGFDTSNVTDMSWMFYQCTGLTSLDLYAFDTRNVQTMANMFNGCSNLVSVNFSSIDTRSLTNTQNMFTPCSQLAYVIWSQGDSVMPRPSSDWGRGNGNILYYVPDNLVDAYKSATNWSGYSGNLKPISQLPSNIAALYEGHY